MTSKDGMTFRKDGMLERMVITSRKDGHYV